MPLIDGRYRGLLYRALNPAYAREPLSGHGAALAGGRLNAKRTPALCTALDPTTALREANQVGNQQSTILVSYRADLRPIFDTRDLDALARYRMTANILADQAWRARMLGGLSVPTQDFARRLYMDGFSGLLIRSFAYGTLATDFNIVLWRWSGDGCKLDVVGDEVGLPGR